MKIGIHKGKGFNEHWVDYCRSCGIGYKIVNCYSTSIIEDLVDCDALMWHFLQEDPRDLLFAKQLIFALKAAGKKVFPDFNSVWFFDDKVGQKYLLESINAPLVPSYVFYSKKEAYQWLSNCTLPKVFKLRSGAGSYNVKLIRSIRQGRNLISRSFSRGFRTFSGKFYFLERLRKYNEGQDRISGVLKGFIRIFIQPLAVKKIPKQKGYIYFQDFIPGNTFDLRLIVIGEKAYGMKRLVRGSDFRASGSGRFVYDTISRDALQIAFQVSRRLALQAVAFDFIFDHNERPLIVEMSCFFGTKGSGQCPGYWDIDLNWHEEKFNPFGWMVDSLLKS